MADGISVDPDRVIAHLRQRHAQQYDTATFEAAQLRAAVEHLQEENDQLRARVEELATPTVEH